MWWLYRLVVDRSLALESFQKDKVATEDAGASKQSNSVFSIMTAPLQ